MSRYIRGISRAIKVIGFHKKISIIFNYERGDTHSDGYMKEIVISLKDVEFLNHNINGIMGTQEFDDALKSIRNSTPYEENDISSRIAFESISPSNDEVKTTEDNLKEISYQIVNTALIHWGIFYLFCHELAHTYLYVKDENGYRQYKEIDQELAADNLAFNWLKRGCSRYEALKMIGVLCGISVACQEKKPSDDPNARTHPKVEERMSNWVKVLPYNYQDILKKVYECLIKIGKTQTDNE